MDTKKNLNYQMGPYMKGNGYYCTYDSNPWFKNFYVREINDITPKSYRIEYSQRYVHDRFGDHRSFHKEYLDGIYENSFDAFKAIEEYIINNNLNMGEKIIDIKDRK